MTEDTAEKDDEEARDLAAAVHDVTHRLTHDLSDTPEDIRDAVAFAPLALVKGLEIAGSWVHRRPKAMLAIGVAVVAGIALGVGGVLRRRSSDAAPLTTKEPRARRDPKIGGRGRHP